MSTSAFFSNETEWEIPPCVAELRVASDEGRVTRNPDPEFRGRKPKSDDFEIVRYQNTGDGNMNVICSGSGECFGGSAIVDRHDVIQGTMPESTDAMRLLCTASRMFLSANGILSPHEVTE